MKIKHFLEGANGDDGGGGWAGRRTKNRLKRSEMDEWNVKWRPVTRIVPSYKKDKKINKVRDSRTTRDILYMKKRKRDNST